ncbi:MAG: hypothetical protein QXL01_07130, partial [Thermoplasmatales archaeon]
MRLTAQSDWYGVTLVKRQSKWYGTTVELRQSQLGAGQHDTACLKRHNLNNLKKILPKEELKGSKMETFKEYEPGYLHMDTTEVRVGKQRMSVYVTVDRATRYGCLEVRKRKTINTLEVIP